MAYGVVALACLAACSTDKPEEATRRRAILRAPDVQKVRAEREAQTRLTDERGELLESDRVVAGVTLPRGFSLALALEHAWYYRSSEVSLEQLDRYFLPRLQSREIRRGARSIEDVSARPKAQPNAVAVSVRIGAAPGAADEREICIEEPLPGPKLRPSEAEIRAQLEARRKFAE
jgi:hypothetical protein